MTSPGARPACAAGLNGVTWRHDRAAAAGWHAAARARSSGSIGASVMPNPLRRCRRRHRAGPRRSPCPRVEVELVDLDVQRHRLPVAHDLHRHRRARRRARHHADELVVVADGLPLNSTMTSPTLTPAGFGRAAVLDAADDRAAAVLGRPELLARRPPTCAPAVEPTPIRPRSTLPFPKLRQDVAHGVDRHREADADVAAALRR